MKKIVMLLLLLPSVVFGESPDSKHESESLTIVVKVDVSPHPPMPDDDVEECVENVLLLEYSIEMRNTGKTIIKLPTLGFDRHTNCYENSIKSKISWDIESANGWITILPDADYGFVQLRPNERAYVRWKEMEFYEERLAKIDMRSQKGSGRCLLIFTLPDFQLFDYKQQISPFSCRQ